MVADAEIDMVFAREWIGRENVDGYIKALENWCMAPDNDDSYESRVYRPWRGVARPGEAD
jgi:hypothetical protein